MGPWGPWAHVIRFTLRRLPDQSLQLAKENNHISVTATQRHPPSDGVGEDSQLCKGGTHIINITYGGFSFVAASPLHHHTNL